LYALFGTFFFMSVMFPTIFALGIRGLGDHTKLGSSLIVMSIVGGAMAPPFMGHIADIHSMRVGFVVPLVCFALIAIYGAVWQKLEAMDSAT
jgi:FHS family L-fucose permease-like MFS transporter